MNRHPWDQAKVSVHYRWPLKMKCVGRGIDNVAVQGCGRSRRGSPKAGTTVIAKSEIYSRLPEWIEQQKFTLNIIQVRTEEAPAVAIYTRAV